MAVVAIMTGTVAASPPVSAAPTGTVPQGSVEGPVAAAYGDGPVCIGMTGPLSGEICRLYRAFFLREPDAAGLRHWMWRSAYGQPTSSIADEFAASTEFRTRYGSLTDREFIELAYRNVVGREADEQGTAYWLQQLAFGQRRGYVVWAMANSNEFTHVTNTHWQIARERAQVYRLYSAYFLREPDQDGWWFWTSHRYGGMPLASISEAFTSSPEFTSTYGNLDNGRFVELVYENVLTRQADAVGLAYWTGLLDTGRVSRGGMMALFSESPEFCFVSDSPGW